MLWALVVVCLPAQVVSSLICPWGYGHTKKECEDAGCYCKIPQPGPIPPPPGCVCVQCLGPSNCTDKRAPFCSVDQCTECPMMKYALDDNCQKVHGQDKPFCRDSTCVGNCSDSTDPWPECYECTKEAACHEPSHPKCSDGHCYPTCETDTYKCQQGIRIRTKDGNLCDANIMDKSAERCMDHTCCGECNNDNDCKDPGKPHCLNVSNTCYECTEPAQCAKVPGVAACSGGACVPCAESFPCAAPCIDGLYDCELPCDRDSDCQKGEVCAVNPGDSLKSSKANRKMCQKPCTSNHDCMAFVHTCLNNGGHQFCGQCLKDEQCPKGLLCHLDTYPTGTWGLCEAPNNVTLVL